MATFNGVEIFTDADIEDEVGCESEMEVEEYFEEFFLETVNEVRMCLRLQSNAATQLKC